MKAIMFDLDDTLYDQVFPFKRAYEEVFGERFEIDIEELFMARHHRSDEVYHLAVRGEITMEEMYIYRSVKPFDDLGYRISDEEALRFQYAYAERQKHLRMSDEIEELLTELCRKRVPMGIISNGPADHQRRKIRSMGLQRWIPEESVFVSGDDGISKPEKHIFERAREGFGLQPQEMVMVGDSFPNDIVGAKNAGWQTVWLKRRGWKRIDVSPKEADYVVHTEKELRECLKRCILT